MNEVEKLNFKIAHVGLNCKDSEEAEKTAKAICAIFGFETRDAGPSFFAADAVECMKTPTYGTNGHIGIGTDDIHAAMDYVKSKGFEFIDESARTLPDGSLKLIYIKGEIGGFAIHLVQR